MDILSLSSPPFMSSPQKLIQLNYGCDRYLKLVPHTAPNCSQTNGSFMHIQMSQDP